MPSMEHSYRWSVFRAKSLNNEKSNTELELFELGWYKKELIKFCTNLGFPGNNPEPFGVVFHPLGLVD